jgi:hypothetical protein
LSGRDEKPVVILQQKERSSSFLKLKIMKAILKNLAFDKELVKQIKKQNVTSEILYVQLISGKITLKEYMALNKVSLN